MSGRNFTDVVDPPVPDGHTRIYEDPTNTWVIDMPDSEITERDVIKFAEDTMVKIMTAEIAKQIDAEILASFNSGSKL